jgi:hypothetical protein
MLTANELKHFLENEGVFSDNPDLRQFVARFCGLLHDSGLFKQQISYHMIGKIEEGDRTPVVLWFLFLTVAPSMTEIIFWIFAWKKAQFLCEFHRTHRIRCRYAI